MVVEAQSDSIPYKKEITADERAIVLLNGGFNAQNNDSEGVDLVSRDTE